MLTYSLDGFSWQLGQEENGWAEARGPREKLVQRSKEDGISVCAEPCVRPHVPFFITLSHLRQKMQMHVHQRNSHLHLDVGSLSFLTFLGLVVYVSW